MLKVKHVSVKFCLLVRRFQEKLEELNFSFQELLNTNVHMIIVLIHFLIV